MPSRRNQRCIKTLVTVRDNDHYFYVGKKPKKKGGKK